MKNYTFPSKEQIVQFARKKLGKHNLTEARTKGSLLKETVRDNVKSVNEKRKKFVPERRKSRTAGYALTGVAVFSVVFCLESVLIPVPESSAMPSRSQTVESAEVPFQSDFLSVSSLSFIPETRENTEDTEIWISDTGEVQTVIPEEETAEEPESTAEEPESDGSPEAAEEETEASFEEHTEAAEEEEQELKEYTISIHSLTVRAEPKNGSKDIGYYHAGSVFKASPVGKGWYEVSYSGQTGYVYGDGYLIETEAE